jgi:hypothetical protein
MQRDQWNLIISHLSDLSLCKTFDHHYHHQQQQQLQGLGLLAFSDFPVRRIDLSISSVVNLCLSPSSSF